MSRPSMSGRYHVAGAAPPSGSATGGMSADDGPVHATSAIAPSIAPPAPRPSVIVFRIASSPPSRCEPRACPPLTRPSKPGWKKLTLASPGGCPAQGMLAQGDERAAVAWPITNERRGPGRSRADLRAMVPDRVSGEHDERATAADQRRAFKLSRDRDLLLVR